VAQSHADIIFINAQVLTQDPENPRGTQLAIQGNKILAVGDDLSHLITEKTKTIDSKGNVITPGFVDAHLHFLWGGGSLLSIPGNQARSKQDFFHIVAEFAEDRQAGSWLQGSGWNEHLLLEKSLPHKSWLDEAAPGYPVILHRHDGHSAVVSSKALELAGITANTPDPVGGLIDRDEKGEPTGILRESAIHMVDSLIPTESEAELEAYFDASQKHLLDNGVTAIGDMIYDLKHFYFLQKMARQGKIKVRVNAYAPILKWEEVKRLIKDGIYEDEWFQFRGLKGFSDGSLGSRTALMLEAYEGTPEDFGIYETDWENVERIRGIMLEADQMNLQVVIHAIGDRANREVLDMFQSIIQANGKRDRRFRIEHAQHIHPDDQKRFSELEVIASVQPAHCVDDARYIYNLLGARSRYAYPFYSLQELGTKMAFGSDWPVSPPDPINTIHAAIHRATWHIEEALDFENALLAHTTGAAHAGFREQDLGMLKAGQLADLVVLEPEFLELASMETAPENLVRNVYVNGEKER